MSVYVPPASSEGSTCSGSCQSESDNKVTFLRSYFNAHMLSMSSHRYIYITWIVIGIVCIVLSASYHLGISEESYIGAAWSRLVLKNRVIKLGRKEEKQKPHVLSADPSNGGGAAGQGAVRAQQRRRRRRVITFPSFGRMFLLAALVIIPVVLTLIGADYIRPSANVFNMKESWPDTNISPYTSGLTRRVLWGIHKFPSVKTNVATLTLPYRTWWTAGGRTGAMTNGLTPFVVVLALKQIPFALFSTKLLGGIAFDRLSFLHKWGGRFVWLFATAHVVLWSVQLEQDQAFGTSIWGFVFLWTKFRWGFVSYGFMTLLVLLSFEPIRMEHYEWFYITHVVCVIGFMVAAALHHPPLAPWMWAPLAWWLAERVTRAAKVAYINGLGFAGRKPALVASEHGTPAQRMQQLSSAPSESASSSTTHAGEWHKASIPPTHSHPHERLPFDHPLQPINNGTFADRRKTRQSAAYDAINDVLDGYTGSEASSIPMGPVGPQRYTLYDDGSGDAGSFKEHSTATDGPSTAHSYDHSAGIHSSANQYHTSIRSQSPLPRPQNYTLQPRVNIAADVAAVLRPGFAYAQLLPGKTLRLTLRTPNRFAWKAGQYVMLNIPKVHWWQSHPFTVASAYNATPPLSTALRENEVEKGLMPRATSGTGGADRTIVLLLRARGGFTNALWDYVRVERERQIRHIEDTTGFKYEQGQVAKTATGVHLRAIIDGPYGSSQRTRWGVHSTIVVICGGSGISYGLSVLEHLCATMNGIRREKNFKTQRVRFVWILREFSHLQWIASALRRCIELVPPELLHVDLFVTSHRAAQQAATAAHMRTSDGRPTGKSSQDKGFSSWDTDAIPSHDCNWGAGRFTDGPDQEEYDVDAYDLTQFAGEDVSAPNIAEAKINEHVHREGKLRRAHTRRTTQKRKKGRGGGTGNGSSAENGLPTLNTDAEIRSTQQAIFDGTTRDVRPWVPQPLRPHQERAYAQHDLGESRLDDHADYARDESEEKRMLHPRSIPPISRALSPAPSQQYLGIDSYFGPRNPSDTNGHPSPSGQSTPLPISPMGSLHPHSRPSPALSGGLGSELSLSGRRTPGAESFYGDRSSPGHALHGAPSVSSTAHLAAYPDGYERRVGGSALAQSSYASGAELEETPSSSADAPIDVDEAEMADIAVIAELARPGYPKLDRIIRQEADASAGRVLVSACGPSSLADLIRSIVSKQIDLKAIRAGKLNAHINVATESYEWGG